ncbi:PREDICTED: lysM domain receptor-like kinase 3 isoform X2 [Nicotiana attenuata]|uniref:non-specific serine/threonine protein kinase n=1 Tax=Nicotiana attenuata TaxID=49451 RepID=A0A291EU99_NICAT|nr:PREDICTED: lysM domain receptor-like kinase 3 isoform X2 [Nicotiana attenuata]ATG22762.1 chitin elicitor receptor kinase 1 [Nicotiana attenuata]
MFESRQRSVLSLGFILITVYLSSNSLPVESSCNKGCDLALGSFFVWRGTNLIHISQLFSISTRQEIIDYNNNDNIPNQDSVIAGTRINIPFSCDCLDGEFLGHVFPYKVISGDTYTRVASNYSDLTTVDLLNKFNSHPENNIPDDVTLKVVVNCSCGNKDVSKDFGLFVTYPLRPEDNLTAVASTANVSAELIRSYNPGANFSAGKGIVFIPGRDKSGNFPPLPTSTGISGGAIAGISIGAIAVVLLLAGLVYVGYYRKKAQKVSLLSSEDHLHQSSHGPEGSTIVKAADSSRLANSNSPELSGITVDKSVEFTYEELATATNDFSIANKIGQGGFGAVYYAELRGEKAAIKKMDMEATREFLAELKVLTHVHHLNLVRLIGYCVEGSLFLVYEYVENGHIGQHLRGTGRDPLPWSTRVQIALDSARGLEYIHEHTVPVYIHRDIKTANILIDKNFHAKVADFGLTKLTEVGSSSLQTRLVGTFGYMPPEYAQYGDVSPKVDVYAFGVVLYELISAKEAIVKPNESVTESKGLVGLFEEVLNQPEPDEDLRKLVDPRLGNDYPLDSVRKMAQLAKACTHENPLIRPSMRSIVVALMTLSSSTEDWDVGSFYGNQGLINLMSGR